MHKRIVTILTVAVLAVCFPTGAAHAAGGNDPSAFEADLRTRMDQYRAAQGAGVLAWDKDLDAVAQTWANEMARQGKLVHRNDLGNQLNSLYGSSWVAGAENIGVVADYERSSEGLHNAFVNSAAHRENMIGDHNLVGIGVVASGGRVWAVINLAKVPGRGGNGTSTTVRSTPVTQPQPQSTTTTTKRTTLGTTPPTTAQPATPTTVAPTTTTTVAPTATTTQPPVTTSSTVVAPTSTTLPAPAGQAPVGQLTLAERAPGGIDVAGWAGDPDGGAVTVEVHINTTLVARTHATFPTGFEPPSLRGQGDRHGFVQRVPALGPGSNRTCAVAVDATGQRTELGCRTVQVAVDPVGALEPVQLIPGGLRVSGWAYDPDTDKAVTYLVSINGKTTVSGTAALGGAPAPAGWGPKHAFVSKVAIGGGTHTVCVTAQNVGYGNDRNVGCFRREVPSTVVGFLGRPEINGEGKVRLSGWALHPATDAAATLLVTVDGKPLSSGTAALKAGAVAAAYPYFGDKHGFILNITPGPGTKRICVQATAAGTTAEIGCHTVTV